MGVRIKLKLQNLHVRVLSCCLMPLQCKATSVQMVGLVLVMWYICITLNCMSIFQVVCCLWIDHVVTVIIFRCSLSKTSQQTNQPHHTLLYCFCLSFNVLPFFSNLMLNNQVAQSRNPVLFRFLIFSNIFVWGKSLLSHIGYLATLDALPQYFGFFCINYAI